MTNIKDKKTKLIVLVLIIIFILLIIYILVKNKNIFKIEQGLNPIITKEQSEEEKKEYKYQGKIIFTRISDNKLEILEKENDKDSKIIYSDDKENEKIQFVSNVSDYSNLIITTKPDNELHNGALYFISIDSGKKEKIIDNFTTNDIPALSPNEEKIAYTLFSNAEFDYGHTLFYLNTKSKEVVKINSDINIISNLAWGFDSNSIAYQKNQQIEITDIINKKTKIVYKIPNKYTITGMSWNEENYLIVSISNSDDNKAKILEINILNNETKELLETESNLNGKAYYLENQLLYIQNQQLYLSKNKNIQEITKANSIIKWLK